MKPRLVYDIPEAAEQLSVSTRVIERLIKDGDLASFKIGRRRVVAHDDLEDFVARQKAAS